MKTFRSKTGPFQEQPYYKPEEIERTCGEELREAGLYPASPEPIRIERFIEKRFKVTPTYDDLPEGVLGWTRFGADGVSAIVVARSLAETDGVVAERRVSSTLAHEAGHGILHSHLFALGMDNKSLFPDGNDVEVNRILCRDPRPPAATPRRNYDGRWWEVQANKAMAALLLPRTLVEACISPLLTQGSFGRGALLPAHRETAAKLVSTTFAVNPIMARFRLAEIFPDTDSAQLTL